MLTSLAAKPHLLTQAVENLSRVFAKPAPRKGAFRLALPARSPSGEFHMQVAVPPGQTVEIQATRDLRYWDTIDVIQTRRGTAHIKDDSAGAQSARFYRAVAGRHSTNCVGFLSLEIPPGSSMIATPLDCSSNTVAALFSGLPEGTTLSRFHPSTQSLKENKMVQGDWLFPGDTFNPGEGAIVTNPTNRSFTLQFVGQVLTEQNSVTFPSGPALLGSRLPISGRLDTDLGFPLAPGDLVSLYSNHNEKYLDYEYTTDGWRNGPPLVRLGEAFWVIKKSPATWLQRLPASPEPATV